MKQNALGMGELLINGGVAAEGQTALAKVVAPAAGMSRYARVLSVLPSRNAD